MRIIIILLLFFNIGFVFSQEHKNIEVIYGVVIEDFSEEELRKMSSDYMRKAIVNKLNNTKNVLYKLEANSKEAVFKKIEVLVSEMNTGGDYSSNAVFYYDNISKNVYETSQLGGIDYLIQYPTTYYQWEITNDTKDIDGYICYKAIGKQKIDDNFRGKRDYELEVWFSPALPYNYGPEMYFGLPGLVFEAHTRGAKIKFVLKSFKIIDNKIVTIEKPKGKPITVEEHTKVFNNFMKRLEEEN